MLSKKFKIMFVWLVLIFLVAFSLGTFAQDNKQELVVGFGQDIVTFDMHNYRGVFDLIGGNMVFETLVTFDRDNNIVPQLATSWEQIDPLTWKFYLREGVKFHDGTPFNAEAVKFNIDRCSEGGGASFFALVDNVETIDDHTFILHLKDECGPVLNNMVTIVTAMMSPKFVEEKGKDITQYACGTGPFKLEEYFPGAYTIFVKNEDYWGEKAKLDRVEFKVIPEESTRMMALRSGELDIIENPPPHELADIEKDENLYFYTSTKNRTLYIAFIMQDENVGGEKNKALRQAIAYAINQNEIVDYILEGLAIPLDKGFVPETIAKGANDPSLVRTQDLEKAKQILKDADIEPGLTVEFWVSRGRYLMDTPTGEVIQQQLGKIGINIDLIVYEMGAMVLELSKHRGQMFQMGWGWKTGDPYQVFYELFHTDSVWNFHAYSNEELDKLIEEAGTTVDFDKRMEIINKAYKIVFDDVVLVPILQYYNLYAVNKKVKGFFADSTELPHFNEVYIEE